MSPELQRSQPPYMQISAHYRDLIRRGELKDGDRLPSTRQIVEQWGVAHATAAKVLSTLRTEGLVKSIPGGAGGTIVSVQELGYAPRDRMQAVRRWGRIYPKGEHARILVAELTANPDPRVVDALGLPEGASVIRRHRITFSGDQPVSVSTSWFDGALAEVAPALLVCERIKEGTPGYIERQTGRVMTFGRDELVVGTAGAQEAEGLNVSIGTPLMLGRNWVRDRDGVVLEYGEYASVPERTLAYEYEIN